MREPTGPSRALSRLVPGVEPAAISVLLPRGASGPAVTVGPGRRPPPGRRYDVYAAASGAVVLVPHGDAALIRQARDGGPASARARAVRAVRAVLPAAAVVVPDGPPAVLSAAAPDRPAGRCSLLVGGGGPRRRAALLVAPDDGGPADRVVKAGRCDAVARRGEVEQRILAQVAAHAAGLAPRALGAGAAEDWSWTAETLVPGRPLSETVTDTSSAGRRRTVAVLEHLADGLGRLAAAPSGRVAPDPVRLRGAHTALGPLLGRLDGVPGVLVHGDLATAHNVLVDGRTARLVDWETARPDGLPLLDLLPLLCLTTARLAGPAGPHELAARVLALCAGQAADSAWLLALVRSAAAGLREPGLVAALGWGHLASMPLVHAELARADGRTVVPWPTAAEQVAAAWCEHPRLGTAWSALTAT